MMRSLILLFLVLLPISATAHSGRLNAEGCHNNSKTGQYECHERKTINTTARTEARIIAKTDYNCSDFYTWQEAQTVYVRAGGPLIDPYDLDRDSDSIACESLQ